MSAVDPRPGGSPPAQAVPTPPPAAPTGTPPATPPAQPPATPPAQPPAAPTRTGMVWVSICAATLLAIALIVFLAQNTRTVAVHFLGLSGSTSLALMLLIAAVAGMLLVVIIGSARIIQLRRRVRRR